MKKTFRNPQDLAEILARIERLRPDSPRQWGKMTAAQMICHLSDSFHAKLGGRPATMADNVLTRTVMKWIALELPLPWPHGVKTMPENDQLMGGTPPEEFEKDRRKLLDLIKRFTAPMKEAEMQPHPYFGPMTDAEWMRWGYLHCDHHLRQFGV